MQISVLQVLLFFVIFFSVVEWILQALWVQSYFLRGIFLRGRTVSSRPAVVSRVGQEQNEYLRNFELKRLSRNLFAIRQGKFGISRTIFFHGCATVDAQSLEARIDIFLNINWLLFSVWLGLLVSGHQWWGGVCAGILAWAVARYFIDDVLMASIADRVQIESERDEIPRIERMRGI